MPIQPEATTRMSWRSVWAISSIRAFITSRAPAAMPQVPMCTVILMFAIPSLKEVSLAVFSLICFRSSMLILAICLSSLRQPFFAGAKRFHDILKHFGIRYLPATRSRLDFPGAQHEFAAVHFMAVFKINRRRAHDQADHGSRHIAQRRPVNMIMYKLGHNPGAFADIGFNPHMPVTLAGGGI